MSFFIAIFCCPYDYAGNITETTDGEGNKIQYEYNLINKLKQITDQTGQTDYFNYDAEGRIKNHVDRNGNKITYSYNIYGSLTKKTEQNTGLSQLYEYHPDGTLKAAIANGMRYGYSYYPDGRLKQKTASGKILLAYEYDLNGNKTKQTDVTGKTTQYSYNETDLLESITDEGTPIVSFNYNEDSTRREIISANGMKTVYDYDIDKNISGLAIEFNGQTLANNKYAYDGNGNRTQKQQLRGTTNYSYDSINRLVKAQYPDYQEELFYDKTGNRTRRIVSGIEEQYQYDVRNRLTSHIKQGVETKYQYDNAGNLLNDGENSYSYDGFNRTTKVETKDGKIQTNKYDAEGLRHEIEENNKLVQFIFNENKEVVVEQTGENLKRLIRSFDLWASECAKEKTWYHYASDEQGSTVFIADEEEIKNRYEYDAWGNATVCEETVENRYKYTGQQFDPITQQYYLRARYYNPIIARFTQEDEYRGDGLNLYAYCDNNPVMYYDPSGHVICDPKAKLYQEKLNDRTLTKKEYKELSQYNRIKNSESRIIPGQAGRVIGGSSTKLGKNMMESMGQKRSQKWSGYQAQHIIPSELKTHPVLKKIGMDLDDASNGMFLRRSGTDVSTMSRHQGYHSVYNDVVKQQLDKIDLSQSPIEIQKQVFDLQKNLKKLQQSGLPLYPSQGATTDLWGRNLNRLNN